MKQPWLSEYVYHRKEKCRLHWNLFLLKGHEFSPLIYNYDQRKGTIEYVDKLDQQGATTGRQSIGLESRV